MKTPLYTISGRHKEPIDERLKVPAPGTYNPEKGYKFVLTYSPQYTFGVKIHTDKYAESPGKLKYFLAFFEIFFISIILNEEMLTCRTLWKIAIYV